MEKLKNNIHQPEFKVDPNISNTQVEEEIKPFCSEAAYSMLQNMVKEKRSFEDRVILLTCSELGLKEDMNLEKIINLAKDKGYVPCPHQVGPALFLQIKRKPPKEPVKSFVVITTPINSGTEINSLFRCVLKDNAWKLYSYPDKATFSPNDYVILSRK